MERSNHTKSKDHTAVAVGAAVAGWFLPGLGHLLMRRWGKAVAYFIAVALLAVVGMRMRGNVFAFGAGDIFSRLGFFADLGNGIFYFLAHQINPAGSDISRAAGDYGTRLIASAGCLNLLCVLEAYHIGLGREGEGFHPL